METLRAPGFNALLGRPGPAPPSPGPPQPIQRRTMNFHPSYVFILPPVFLYVALALGGGKVPGGLTTGPPGSLVQCTVSLPRAPRQNFSGILHANQFPSHFIQLNFFTKFFSPSFGWKTAVPNFRHSPVYCAVWGLIPCQVFPSSPRASSHCVAARDWEAMGLGRPRSVAHTPGESFGRRKILSRRERGCSPPPLWGPNR